MNDTQNTTRSTSVLRYDSNHYEGEEEMKDRNKLAVYEITCVPEGVSGYVKEKIALFGKRFEGHPNDPDIIMMEFYGLDYEDIKGVQYRFIEEINYYED